MVLDSKEKLSDPLAKLPSFFSDRQETSKNGTNYKEHTPPNNWNNLILIISCKSKDVAPQMFHPSKLISSTVVEVTLEWCGLGA
jgi:hypothetical protein